MNKYINAETKNLYSSVLYLVFVILKEKWLTLTLIILFCLLAWTPFALWWTKEDGGEVGSYTMSLIPILPILLISFILVPIVHQQIFSSSIKLRMEAAGVPFKVYSISLIALFTAFLTILFYILICLFAIFFNEVTVTVSDYDGYHTETHFKGSYGIAEMIFLPFICILGLVSVGVVIALAKINEIWKGIIIFILIVVTVLINNGSTYILSFENNDSIDPSTFVNHSIKLYNAFLLNPFGTIVYSFQTTINSDLSVVLGHTYSNSVYLVETYSTHTLNGLFLMHQIVGCLYSFGFLGLAIILS